MIEDIIKLDMVTLAL